MNEGRSRGLHVEKSKVAGKILIKYGLNIWITAYTMKRNSYVMMGIND